MRLAAFVCSSEYTQNIVFKAKPYKNKMFQSPLHPPSTLLMFDHLRMSWPNKVHGCITDVAQALSFLQTQESCIADSMLLSTAPAVKEDMH